MRRKDPYAAASNMAEAIIKGLRIETLPVDPKAIALDRGIEVIAKPTEDAGVSGMLIRLGNDFAIAYATHYKNEGFENFSVGHELGHYFLQGHADAVIGGNEGMHVSRAGFASSDKYEAEADRFAASFLMPRYLFFPALTKAGDGLAAIESLATLCKTSLHATAIRYTQCCREPVAVIISVGRTIDHCFMSDSFQYIEGIDWLRRGMQVPRTTNTFAFNNAPENVTRGYRVEGVSNLQQWFGGQRSISLSEDVIGLGRYGKTLTVLYELELPEPEEEEEENELIESWTPKFRR